MPIVPLAGHTSLRDRLHESVDRGTLPGSMLIHGPRGIGKQRLALWLGQLLLCDGTPDRPCGACRNCKYATELSHPDLLWFFPRPRKEDGDASADDVKADMADAVSERRAAHGLYATPSGTEGIFISAIHALVREAAKTPAIAARRVVIVGDAERMVPQEGSDQAANAFLKLLEEPPAKTTIILTSSEPGALLPTILSRVVSVRANRLSDAQVGQFIALPAVESRLDGIEKLSAAERVRAAAGAPGSLFTSESRAAARANAERILAAATSGARAKALRAAFVQGSAGARGAFADSLDELSTLLRDRTAESLARGDTAAAYGAARAMPAVERAKLLANGNVTPQLVTAALLRDLAGALP